jgi:hypothetical protein
VSPGVKRVIAEEAGTDIDGLIEEARRVLG